MSQSTQFAIGIHILILAAVDADTPLTSERAGLSAGTNAAFIRKIASKLAKAKLLKIRKGKYGGMELGKPAHQITMLDVYRAVDNSELLYFHASIPFKDCFVGSNILPTLEDALSDVSRDFKAGLDRITLADISAQLLKKAGREDKLAVLN